jgi:hypothetical protein
MSKVDSLRVRLLELEDNVHAGSIPTTSADGQRAWIEGGGCGLSFLCNLTKGMRDHDELRVQCELWARAEVDGSNFGEIGRMNRQVSRDVLRP